MERSTRRTERRRTRSYLPPKRISRGACDTVRKPAKVGRIGPAARCMGNAASATFYRQSDPFRNSPTLPTRLVGPLDELFPARRVWVAFPFARIVLLSFVVAIAAVAVSARAG